MNYKLHNITILGKKEEIFIVFKKELILKLENFIAFVH